MNWREYLKSGIAFLGLLATNVATQLMTTDTPWPTNGGEWVRWGVSIVAGTWLVYKLPNEVTDPARSVGRSVRLKGVQPLPARHEAPE